MQISRYIYSTIFKIMVDSEKNIFNNLKHCYSPGLAATRIDFSLKVEQFTTFKSTWWPR